MAYLYVLCCPWTGAVRYVGSTENPLGRIRTHRNVENFLLREWFTELKQQGGWGPILVVVGRTGDKRARYNAERALYKRCALAGCDLLNLQFASAKLDALNLKARRKLVIADAISDMKMVAAVFAAEEFNRLQVSQ
jgi:hypothetical protein